MKLQDDASTAGPLAAPLLLAFYLIVWLMLLGVTSHAQEPLAAANLPAPASLAAPGDAAALDLVLRDLAYLGPNALTDRVSELREQVAALEEVSGEKRTERQAIAQQSDALNTFTEAVGRLARATPDVKPLGPLPPAGAPWKRHAIESGLRKSEGIRLGDVDRDGLEDLVVAWEGQEVSRVYLNPGPAEAYAPWPSATVDTTPNVEDAALVDLDGDGALDVVSSLEKGTERVTVAWGPTNVEDVLRPAAWSHDEFKQVAGVTMWMYAAPIRLAPGGPVSLVIGGKNYEADASAELGLLVSPGEGARDLSRWQWVPLAKASWVMSIEVYDLDRDGLEDVLFTDKHGPLAGVHWLKNPGAAGEWTRQALTGENVKSANFLTVADLDKDGLQDIVATVELERAAGAVDHAHRRVLFLRRASEFEAIWDTHEIQVPPGIGQSKGIAVGDVDLDGRNDIVLSSTGAEGDLVGTSWLRYESTPFEGVWRTYNIAGPLGTKYDLIYLRDLDADGDLDVLANDEKEGDIGLGVFWYENPTVSLREPGDALVVLGSRK